jgi:hypothetical protein
MASRMASDFWRQWQALAASAIPAAHPAAPGLAAFADTAERFAQAARDFFEVGLGPAEPASRSAAAQAFSNFLRDQFAEVFKPPRMAAVGVSMNPVAPFASEAPALGLTREHQQRAQRAAAAWGRMQEAQRRLQRLWSDTLSEAATAFAAQLRPPSAPPDAAAFNRLYDTWIDCAEAAYARTAHSDAFCDALADYVNAASSWRLESNAGIEAWAKLLDLPTRSEINTLAQRLRSVEEQMRAQAKPRRRRPRPKGKS